MKVAIIVGSDSDLPVINEAVKTLQKFGVQLSVNIASAHRTPNKISEVLKQEEDSEVIIAAAGVAAHLPGVIAAHTTKPVIGIPMQGGALNGIDALLSIVQMPSGVPVATVAIGKAGAINAALLAVEILSVKYNELKKELDKYKKDIAEKINEKDQKLKQIGIEKYIKEELNK